MIILLGSRAAKAWFSDFREPKDWDAVASAETIMQWSEINRDIIRSLTPKSERKLRCKLHDGATIEFEILGTDQSTRLLAFMADTFLPTAFPGGVALAATPAILWLTKRSHLQWNIHWEKNMWDFQWLKWQGTPTSAEREYYHVRLDEHKERFKNTKAKLNMDNDTFFAKSAKIGRVMDHDRIHEIVAYNQRPLFEMFKNDLNKASLSRILFEQADPIHQLNLVREEAMVIALERYIIPALPDIIDIDGAYRRALQRICTTLTSGWFRDFAIEHWTLFNRPNKDFVTPILKELSREVLAQ